MIQNRKETRRVTDEPLYLNDNIDNGFVPRDYFNPELRHHQMLFIAFITLCLAMFKITGAKLHFFF